jgi:hypothetical protein
VPVRPDSQTEFVRPRWSAYVHETIDSHRITRSHLATLAEVPTSRVAEWLDARRGVEPQTAFQIGEALRADGLATDGFCALYACGYPADLFVRLRTLTTGLRASRTSRTYALAVYCGLPGRMLSRELRLLDVVRAPERRSPFSEGADAYEFARLKLAGAAQERRRSSIVHLIAEIEAACKLDDPTIREILQSEEISSETGIQVDKIPFADRLEHDIAPSVVLAAGLPTTALGWFERLVPFLDGAATTNIRRDAGGVIMDIVIAVARAVRVYDPATMTPRLWRMLGEWAYGLNPERFIRWQPVLPALYRSYHDDEE